jgi:dihydrofolate synthase/folylpolyglutamate synthase
VRGASVPGRLQRVAGAIATIVDVAHNPQAARELADWLARNPVEGRTHAVFGALGDKDVAGIVDALRGRIDRWHLAGLAGVSPRGLDALALRQRADVADATVSDDVPQALAHARAAARAGDRIVAFGSFFVVSAVLAEALHRARV